MSDTSTGMDTAAAAAPSVVTAGFSPAPPPRDVPPNTNTTIAKTLNTSNNRESQTTPPVATAAMESHDTGENAQTKEVANNTSSNNISRNVIYTPASTVSSSKADSAYGGDENTTAPTARNNAVWGEWWKAEGLAAQVGSLSKELTQLKDLISKQNFEDEANDVSRLKANHRSSLASLAEFHRSEMAGLNLAHTELMKKLELQHMEELRSARRNNGHDRDLIQGLHQSYSKQIENLVLDLSEARREIKELKLRPATAEAPVVTDPALDDVCSRTLTMRLTFENLDAPLAIAELSMPHPGPSFDALLRILSFTVKNHLHTLNNTANFFICRPREEHVAAAMKIRHWHNSALEEKVHFSFTSDADANTEGKSMQERWEDGQWRSDGFVLGVLCTAEGWENFMVPPYPPEAQDYGKYLHESVIASLGTGSSAQKLVPISEGSIGDVFDPAAELERINRELGNLQLHQQLQEQAGRELGGNYDEDKENCEPAQPLKSRKATVESVKDEDEMSTPHESPSAEGVPIIKPPKPRQPKADPPSSSSTPLIWEDNQSDPATRSTNASLEEGLKEFLEKDIGNAQPKGKAAGSSNSWLFEDIFSPIPQADQGEEKDDEEDIASTYPKSIIEEPSTKEPPPSIDPSILKECEPDRSDKPPGFGWRWLPEGIVKPSSPLLSVNTDGVQSANTTAPARETYMGGSLAGESDAPNPQNPDYFQDPQSEARPYAAEHPLFSFTDSRSSPAPPPAPPAPEASTRGSPTLTEYPRTETDMGTSHDQGESAHGNDDDGADPADDTPRMEAAHSVVSSTPLLGSDATHKSVRFGGKKRPYPSDDTGQRMPAPPFPPMSGDNGSQRSSKYSASRYEGQGYFRSGGNTETTQAPGGAWGGTQSSAASDYGPESAQGENKRGYGQPPVYPWGRHAEDEEEEEEEDSGYRAGSVSSSTTTTDRRNTGPYGQPTNINNIGPFRYGFGGMRPMAMGPLGPRGGIPTFTSPQQADMIFQQQMRNKMEDIFGSTTNGFGPPPRSHTAPTFSGGPVFAPNPPHSVAARSGVGGGGGVAVSAPSYQGPALGGPVMSGLARYPFDWPISLNAMPPHIAQQQQQQQQQQHHHAHPHVHTQHLFASPVEQQRGNPRLFANTNPGDGCQHLFAGANNPGAISGIGGGEPRLNRTFSAAADGIGISPLLWGSTATEQQQPEGGAYPGMLWGGQQQQQQQQSNTPVSQQQQQQWFQQQQGGPPPFGVDWDGSPIPLPMRMPGPWSGYSA